MGTSPPGGEISSQSSKKRGDMVLWIAITMTLIVITYSIMQKVLAKTEKNELLEQWESMSNLERDALLRHPTWKQRCECRQYGFPWGNSTTVIGRDGNVHEEMRCYPVDERI